MRKMKADSLADFTRPAVSGKVSNSPFFHWARPDAVPIHRLPSVAPRSEITAGLGSCFPAGRTKGTKRTRRSAVVPQGSQSTRIRLLFEQSKRALPRRRRRARARQCGHTEKSAGADRERAHGEALRAIDSLTRSPARKRAVPVLGRPPPCPTLFVEPSSHAYVEAIKLAGPVIPTGSEHCLFAVIHNGIKRGL